MMKSSHLYLGLAAMLLLPAAVTAQDNAAATAVTEAVKRQHDTLVLRQKIADARAAAMRKDTATAAKLYQESVSLAQEIGRAGIEAETQQAVSGLVSTSLALAEDAQGRQDYGDADTQLKRALKADPKSQTVLEFKRQNDALIEANRGKLPSPAVVEQAPAIMNQKKQAAQLVQDGKFFYEMGKLDEAEKKLADAVKIDPDNTGAYYYQLLIKQARYKREASQHLETLQEQMNTVEKHWVLPTPTADLPKQSNPYATNTLVYTGPGRQAIMARLDRIFFTDPVSFDGPLNSVLEDLSKLSKLRDPEKRGINFMINPNPDQSGPPIPAAGGGGLGVGGEQPAVAQPVAQPPAIDPTTGQIIAPTTAGNVGGEKVDIGTSVTVKLNLSNVRLADVLDAILETAEHPEGHPIKYSVKEYGIVFQDKGAESPMLFTRFFKIDPNTFYSGLEGVTAQPFGSIDSTSSGGGGGGGGGGSRGGGGGGNSQNQSSAVVGVVNAIPGAGSARSSGGGGGRGGGGGGGTGGSAANPLNGSAGGAAGGGVNGGDGGLRYVSQVNLASDPSIAARSFFTALGVNLTQPAGKSVFFNDKTGYLMVRATEQDLDTIEKAIQILNQAAPQIHIKTRFIEVAQDDNKQFGLDWYLGQFQVGHNVAGTGGTSPSLNVPTSAANPLGAFPGNTAENLISGAATDQLLTGGLRNSGPVLGTLTGILTDPNFRVVLHALEQRGGTENLGEPEVVTTSGRQAQMKATEIRTIVVGLDFQQGNNNLNTGGNGGGNNGGTGN
jgi:tetratricopeptide (TPR) repeat protein